MKKSVYLETSIASFYYERRKDVKAVAWREISRQWWKEYRKYYQVVSSSFVILELKRGTKKHQSERIKLIEDIEHLNHLPIIDEIVNEYIKNKVVPE